MSLSVPLMSEASFNLFVVGFWSCFVLGFFAIDVFRSLVRGGLLFHSWSIFQNPIINISRGG